ncbi:probable cytochrome P450 9f2 [Phlebotomus papatasi]|uniref:probable cytochrome P450 9f2 n=1 Tax=Phlebotomus papatasi TaxID=29031 RepID=UPI00248472BF|nr:probable cytochrome P450 9f2 [Phlebotomus papatasi]
MKKVVSKTVMLFMFLILTTLAFLVYYIYQLGTKNEDYFIKRGLKFRKPLFLLGNNFPIVFRRSNFFDFVKNLCKGYTGEKMIGYFAFREPVVVVLDPEIAKQLAVKEFDNFADHKVFLSEEVDQLVGNSLMALTGQKWKDMRATLSPAFTGSKMRLMCDFMVESCDQMVSYLKEEVTKKGLQSYDVKELIARLAVDVIGTCAFGVKVDSLKDKNNEFFVTSRSLINFTSISLQIKFILYIICPQIMKFFKISFFSEAASNFIRKIVLDTMKTREEKNIIRPDMIHLLMEAKKGNLIDAGNDKDSAGFATVEESDIGMRTFIKRSWKDDELVGQCFLFFLAGYEALSTITSFVIYEIMVNTDVQDKLYQEVSEMDKKSEEKSLNYDTLKQLKYLDMVVSEVLRKWSGPALDRVCTRDFTFKYDVDKEYTFHKNDLIWIPTASYHHNPEFFPNPEKFDPERFSDENKDSINLSAYAPFGIGPRNCIGSRFALMEMKSTIYYLVLNFHVEPTEKTQIPIKFTNSVIGLQPEKGIHAQFRPRY